MKLGLLLGTALLLFPLATFAATYQYITVQGDVASVSANSEAEAMMLAPNKDPHSGVMRASGSLETGGTVTTTSSPSSDGTHLYHYIDRNGVVQDVRAMNETEAMSRAVNMDPHSGVKLDMGQLHQGDTVSL